jgi:hypothetical protein
MLTIRAAQIAALAQSATDRFTANASEYLTVHFPGAAAKLGGLPGVWMFVQRGIHKARGFGVVTEGAVTVLLELWIQFGEDFERSPLRAFARNILANPDLPGSAKAELIRDRHQEMTGGCVMVPY